MANSASERTEQPTPRRLRDARRKGQVAVSRDLASAVSLVCALGAVVATLPVARRELAAGVLRSIERAGSAEVLDVLSASNAIEGALWMLLKLALPIGLAALAGGVAVTMLQTHGLVTGSAFTPKLERLNPIAGLKRLVAARTIVELVKTWIRLIVIGAAASFAVAGEGLAGLVASSWSEPGDAMHVGARVSMIAALAVAVATVGIGGADVLLQRWLHARDLRMTKDEVRRDHKEEEGDPHVKQARKQVHRELALSTMLRATRSASFVAVNPTHLAVAVAYDEGRDEAPRVVAKGAGEMAKRIRREAERSRIRVVRNKPLARALFSVPVTAEIPEELYIADAETIAFIREADDDSMDIQHPKR